MKKKFMILGSVIIIFILAISINIKAEEDEDIYSFDFSSAEKVNEDFNAYYKYDMGTESREILIGSNEDDDTHLYVKDNAIIRKNFEESINQSLETKSYTILTLTKEKYVNFELTIDYKMGTASYYWPVVAFRQAEEGKYFLESGLGAFVQQQGRATIWGTDGVGGPYESDVISGYSQNANDWHTMKLVVDGIMVKMFIDGSLQPVFEKSISTSVFRSGYISLISVNNNSEFRNLKIKRLPIKELQSTAPQPPVDDANTANSLNNLANRVDKVNDYSNISGNNNVEQKPKKSTSRIIGVSIVSGLALISIGFNIFLFLTRKQ